jgi:glycogen(starch) synthase
MIGGYENLANDLSKELSKKIDVHIVCYNYDDSGVLPVSEKVVIHEFSRVTNVKYIGTPINSLVNNLRLLHLIRKEKICVINAHPVFPGGLDAVLSKICGVPLICTSHGADIQINDDLNYGARRNIFVNLVIKFILRITDYHTVVSKSMFPDAVDAGSDISKVRVIYNGLNLRSIPQHKHVSRSKYNLLDNDFFILYMGRLHVKKCPSDLIRAMQKVVSEIPSAKLVVAGKGGEKRKLEDLVSHLNLLENITFAGFVSDNEKWQLMMSCDVFVLPSEVEAFGISVIEAMACSKPVVVTDIGPFTEIVKHKETGLVVPLHSPDAIAEAIIELYQNNDLRKNIGDSARKEIENRFNIAKIADDYLELYMKAFQEKTSQGKL